MGFEVISIVIAGWQSIVEIVDRSKDVIKSGGEWISSIDLENTAVGHPGVGEACVIGVLHEKWDERPVLLIKIKRSDFYSKSHYLTSEDYKNLSDMINRRNDGEPLAYIVGKIGFWNIDLNF